MAVSGGSAQTRQERPNSAGAPKLHNSDDVSMREPHCKVMLSGVTRHCMKGGSRRTLGGDSGKKTLWEDL